MIFASDKSIPPVDFLTISLIVVRRSLISTAILLTSPERDSSFASAGMLLGRTVTMIMPSLILTFSNAFPE